MRAIDFYLCTEAVKAKAPPLWEDQKKSQNQHLFESVCIHLDDDETRNDNNVIIIKKREDV